MNPNTLGSGGMKRTRQIFKYEMSTKQSKANLNAKILFGEIIHHFFKFDSGIKKMLVRDFYRKENSTLDSGL